MNSYGYGSGERKKGCSGSGEKKKGCSGSGERKKAFSVSNESIQNQMGRNCCGSGSGERKKGCSAFGEAKANQMERNCYGSGSGERKENQMESNCYGSGSSYRVITNICELNLDMEDEEDPVEIGGVFDIYDRNSDPNGPRKDLLHYAQLAIASYNKTIKTKSQRYSVVDIIRSEKYLVNGHLVFIDFTANQDNADAITFRTSLWEKYDGIDAQVSFIGPVTEKEAASKQIRDTSIWP